MRSVALVWLVGVLSWHSCSSLARAQRETLELWPGTAPGGSAAVGEERDTSTETSRDVAGQPVIRLGHVSQPTLSVFPAPPENNTGAAVLICPGGGYHILAYDLEGTEVAQWLNSIGITGIVLKYRVPRTAGKSPPIEPLQDAQRALSLVRSRAEQWNINPHQIGVLGFSAGGHLAARLSTSHTERAYEPLDRVDEISCRPDFSLLIYPAYLFDKESEELVSADLPIQADTPPTFIAMAADDPVDSENALRFALGMKRAQRPVELHLYAAGGHGYGLRRTEMPATAWPEPATVWLRGVLQDRDLQPASKTSSQ